MPKEAALTRDQLAAETAKAMQSALDRHGVRPGLLYDHATEAATPVGVLLAETALDHLATYIEPLL